MASITERNNKTIEQIFFRLLETLKLCNQLDLSGLGPLEQKEWSERISVCKNALEFTKKSVEKLGKAISPDVLPYS